MQTFCSKETHLFICLEEPGSHQLSREDLFQLHLLFFPHTDFQLEPTARSSASSHLVHRIKDIIKDNIKDAEILFSFTLSDAALINFHFSLHPLLSLDETLILNTDTLTASAVLSVISLEETKCSIVVSLATFYFNSH